MSTPFICDACSKPALAISHSLALGPDEYDDEVSLQTLKCSACNAQFLGLYEESRGGSDVSFHHRAWPADAATYSEVDPLLAKCPTPTVHRCTCPAHTRFTVKNYRPILTGKSFRLRYR